MEELIAFTLVLKQLDDKELIQFLSESLKNHGHSLFGKLFFNYFNNHHHRTEIKTHTQCLMDIINARENKPNRSASHLRIDKLPSALIAECASYLPLNEYVRLSRTNRQMFVSTNKPFTLYELPCSAFRKYPQTMSMHKFKSVKSLCIDIEQFNQTLSTSNQSIWKHSSFDKVQLWNKSNDETNTTLFLDKNAINVDGISTLDLFDFGNLVQGHCPKPFTVMLGRFRNMKHLSLREIYLSAFQYGDRDVTVRAFSKWFANLTSLYVSTTSRYTMRLVTLIVNTVGHQLESLTFPADYASELHCNFSNLKELEFECCDTTNPQCLTPFAKVTTLQSMNIQSDNENMLKSCIDFMLKKQTSIKQMKIVSEIKNLKCISDQIQLALFDSHYKGVRRDSLFLYFKCWCSAWSSDIVLAFEVFRLVNTLQNVDVNDFMIRIDLAVTGPTVNGNDKIKQLASEFDKMKDDYLVYCYDNVITIGNKTCKINGLQWRYLFR